MNQKQIAVLTLAVLFATSAFSQIPLNPNPSREVGHPQLALATVSPNLVEGRELFAPQGVALDTDVSPNAVYVADTSNNRVLAWKNAAQFANGAPADLFIGQKDKYSTFQQGPGTSFSVGLSLPTSVAVRKGALYVVDAGNNRILRFPSPFTQTDIFPDLVIGQPNFTSKAANYTGQVNAQGINLTSGGVNRAAIAFDSAGNLWFTDTGNRRVLRFKATDLANPNVANSLTADLELGQLDFSSVSTALPQTAASTLIRDRFLYPAGLGFDAQGNLYVCDRDLNRVLVFQPNFASGISARRIMGVVQQPTDPNAAAIPQVTYDRTQFLAPLGMFPLPGSAGIGIIDAASSRILIFDPLSQWPTEDVAFSPAAKAVIGQNSDFNNRKANNGQPTSSATTFNTPYAAVLSPANELFVADGGNNRVVVLPYVSGIFQPATRVLGQDTFDSNAPNLIEGREFRFVGSAGNATALDTSIIVDTTTDTPHLYVADSFNNRILGFRDLRQLKPGDKADIVIGQPNFTSSQCNYPANNVNSPNQSSLCHPVGLALDNDGNLYVADTFNGRVLRFPTPFSRGGTLPQADLVLGQTNFTTQITDPTPRTMAQPYGLAFAGDNGLFVSDQALNRVLFFPKVNGAFTNGQSATKVLGQPNFSTTASGTTDNRMHSPQLIACDTDSRVYVADQLNNRVLIFDSVNNVPSSDAHAGVILSNFSQPTGVFVSARTGEIWVANTFAGTALRYPRFDQLQLSNNPSLVINYQVQPLAIAQDQFGDLFVADASNRVVIHYPPVAAVNHGNGIATKPLAPGLLTDIYPQGQLFGTETKAATDRPNFLPLPTDMADVQVTLNDTPVPLYYVSPGQINVVIPYGAPSSGTAELQVLRKSTGQIYGSGPVLMNNASPAILSADAGTIRQALVLNQDNTVNSPTNPAPRGTVIQIYATGQGPVNNPPADGDVPRNGLVSTTDFPRVNIGGIYLDDEGLTKEKKEALQLFSGLSPNFPGIWQINVKIPQVVVAGLQVQIVLQYRSIYSQDPGTFKVVIAVSDPK